MGSCVGARPRQAPEALLIASEQDGHAYNNKALRDESSEPFNVHANKALRSGLEATCKFRSRSLTRPSEKPCGASPSALVKINSRRTRRDLFTALQSQVHSPWTSSPSHSPVPVLWLGMTASLGPRQLWRQLSCFSDARVRNTKRIFHGHPNLALRGDM